jgi:hypothetical protein
MGFLGIGFQPKSRLKDMPMMPKVVCISLHCCMTSLNWLSIAACRGGTKGVAEVGHGHPPKNGKLLMYPRSSYKIIKMYSIYIFCA